MHLEPEILLFCCGRALDMLRAPPLFSPSQVRLFSPLWGDIDQVASTVVYILITSHISNLRCGHSHSCICVYTPQLGGAAGLLGLPRPTRLASTVRFHVDGGQRPRAAMETSLGTSRLRLSRCGSPALTQPPITALMK